jgi:hypothetical protein
VAVTLKPQAGNLEPALVFYRHRAHILTCTPQRLSLARLADVVQDVHKRSPEYSQTTANCVWFAVELLKAISGSLSAEGYADLKTFLSSSQTHSLYKPHLGIPSVILS